jgi:hypothetical protein
MIERLQFELRTLFGVTTIVALLLWSLLTVPEVLGDVASLLVGLFYCLVMFVVWSLLCLVSLLVVFASLLTIKFVASGAVRWLAYPWNRIAAPCGRRQ